MSLRNLGGPVQIEGVATGDQAIEWLERNGVPSLVLMDIKLPDGNGITLLKTILRRFPGVRVAMLSGSDDLQTIDESIRAGAAGFITKASSAAALSAKVSEILRGVQTVSSSQIKLMTDPQRASGETNQGKLTKMQTLVLEHLLLGWSNKQIAARLEIAEGTVKTHSSAIFRFFGVKSRAELLATQSAQ